jgi:hypothetical protein
MIIIPKKFMRKQQKQFPMFLVISDELTLAQAQKPTLKWPLLLDAIKTELTSLIVTTEVF